MLKTERLKQAYEYLRLGKVIVFVSDDRDRECTCWFHPYKPFIMYRCYGQSVVRKTLSDLRWIAKTIAHCTTYEYEIK